MESTRHLSTNNKTIKAMEQLTSIFQGAIKRYNISSPWVSREATPMAPPVTKVIIHEKSQQRGSWSPHVTKGYYVRHAPHHYQLCTVYVTKTAAGRICNMV